MKFMCSVAVAGMMLAGTVYAQQAPELSVAPAQTTEAKLLVVLFGNAAASVATKTLPDSEMEATNAGSHCETSSVGGRVFEDCWPW